MNNFYRHYTSGKQDTDLIDMYGVKIVGKIGTLESSYVPKTDVITYLKIIKNGTTIYDHNLDVNHCIKYDEFAPDKLETVCWLLMENVDAIDIENIMDRLIHNELSLAVHRLHQWKEREQKKAEQKARHEQREQNKKEGYTLLEKHDLYLFDGVKTPNNGYQTMVLRFYNKGFKEAMLQAYKLYMKDGHSKTVGSYMDFLIQYPHSDDAKQIDIIYQSDDFINWNDMKEIEKIMSLVE